MAFHDLRAPFIEKYTNNSNPNIVLLHFRGARTAFLRAVEAEEAFDEKVIDPKAESNEGDDGEESDKGEKDGEGDSAVEAGVKEKAREAEKAEDLVSAEIGLISANSCSFRL